MPEILRRKLMERIDIASEPDDGEVLEEIDRLILGEEETRYLPVAQKAELRRQLFYSVRRLDVLQELLEDAFLPCSDRGFIAGTAPCLPDRSAKKFQEMKRRDRRGVQLRR